MHRILIVDDHPVVRRGLADLVGHEPDLTVCGTASDAGEAQHLVEREKPDLILLDLAMEGMNGIEFSKQLRSHHPDVRVLVVSMYDERIYAERALQAGAHGFIRKRSDEDEIVDAIRRVLAGETYVSPALRGRLQPLQEGEAPGSPLDRLSDRELEVFLQLGRGYPPREIADSMGLSVKTVETYRQNLKQKLRLASATELTRYAVEWYHDQTPQ